MWSGSSVAGPAVHRARVAAPRDHLHVVEHRGRAGLDHLAGDWRRLSATMEAGTCFHTYEAHVAYVDHLAVAPERLRYVVLADEREVRAICPLEARTDRTLRIPLRIWGAPWHPHWPLADVICPEDDVRQAVLPALVEHLRREPMGRRLLALGPLPTDSVLWEGLASLRPGDFCSEQVGLANVFCCDQPFEVLASRFSKKLRSSLRRNRRRLEALPDAHFTTSDATDLAADLEVFLDLEASGWKGKAGGAIRVRPELVAFYRQLAATLEGDARCEINALHVDGRLIAAEFCTMVGEEYAGLKMCYDEDHARLSPSLLLLERTLERCCQDPAVTRFNQTSDAAWQRSWHPDSVALRQVHVAIGLWTGRPLVALLRFRYGRGRRVVRWVRGKLSRESAGGK